MLIATRTPLRVSFFGGGTDLKEFYANNGYGAVLSATIDKFVYVTVKRHGELFDEPYRLNYSKTEIVSSLDAVENEIGREAMRLLNVKPAMYISTVADVPSGSGLGSSSSYAVGLLNALCALEARRTTFGDLAEMACHIEIDVLKKPIGKQDQVSAAAGGLNHIRFFADGSVSITPISARTADLHDLFGHFQLFWTGVTRSADSILTEQRKNIRDTNGFLLQMRDLADEATRLIQRGVMNIQTFGEMLDAAWQLKKKLATSVSNSKIDELYARARAAGAIGGKLCGAGGGGFLLFCAQKSARNAIRAALPELREVNIAFEPTGSTILFSSAHGGEHSNLRSLLRERVSDDSRVRQYHEGI
jgi:D-glycero-alpha-D-manno-heptose-7-phosphate kinase